MHGRQAWRPGVRVRRSWLTLEVTCLATAVAAASRSSGLSAAVSLERSMEDIVVVVCAASNRVGQGVRASLAGVHGAGYRGHAAPSSPGSGYRSAMNEPLGFTKPCSDCAREFDEVACPTRQLGSR